MDLMEAANVMLSHATKSLKLEWEDETLGQFFFFDSSLIQQ